MVSPAEQRKYFLPYQERWLADRARFKIAKKSRRVGYTYAQSYEDVRDAVPAEGGMDVWFSSADESAAREYIRYCEQWTKLFDTAARYLGEIVIDTKNDIKAMSIEFSNGKRIHALSSNPKAFRSKGGKLVLDEFAFHPDADALWKAASPIVTWGYPVRILSTFNGKGNRYYRMVQDAESGNRYSLHTVTIEDAIAEGLVDKILGRPATAAERAAFIEDCKATAGDAETYMQEYMCIPVDEATAWLTWEIITRAEHPDAGRPELYAGGDCYVGIDIGRRKDLFVIEVDELVGDVLWTREVVRLKNQTFAAQDAEIDRVFTQYRVRRACMDQTGMGEKMVEDAQRRHGAYAVEGVLFTAVVKQHLATLVKQHYEDQAVRTPPERAYRESHHAVRKLTTVAGNPRFDAERSEAGHADEFWAHGLALHAAEGTVQPAAGVYIIQASDDDPYRPQALPKRAAQGRLIRRSA